MKLIIGTDEAGYGPNLGPLVVAATAWPIQNDQSSDLFDSLENLFCRANETTNDRLKVGDSKEVYKSGDGLSELERSVLPLCFAFRGNEFESKSMFSNLTKILQVEPSGLSLPWYEQFDPTIPFDFDSDSVSESVTFLESGYLESTSQTASKPISPQQISSVIEPNDFNVGCDLLGNKATFLSDTTLQLVRKLILEYRASEHSEEIESVEVICDKHGGRSHYAGVLQNTFKESWIQVLDEQRESSRYEMHWNDWPITFQFIARGESQLPVAYASMIAKYLREVSMKAFNQFWSERIPEIKPTAGYPVDAKRFRVEIESSVRKLGLVETNWWRLK